MRNRILALCFVALTAVLPPSNAQQPTKRPLTHRDYESWRALLCGLYQVILSK